MGSSQNLNSTLLKNPNLDTSKNIKIGAIEKEHSVATRYVGKQLLTAESIESYKKLSFVN